METLNRWRGRRGSWKVSFRGKKYRLLAGLALSLTTISTGPLFLTGCNIGCFFAPCDRAVEVTVIVTDPSGKPLQGVKVDVLGSKGETDFNGCSELEGVTHAEQIWLRAEKAGYAVYEEGKAYDFYAIKVTLEPTDSLHPSTATWQPSSSQSKPPKCSSGAPA